MKFRFDRPRKGFQRSRQRRRGKHDKSGQTSGRGRGNAAPFPCPSRFNRDRRRDPRRVRIPMRAGAARIPELSARTDRPFPADYSAAFRTVKKPANQTKSVFPSLWQPPPFSRSRNDNNFSKKTRRNRIQKKVDFFHRLLNRSRLKANRGGPRPRQYSESEQEFP